VAPQLGDVVAGYRLDELIGVGGSGCPVYRAMQLRLNREVALKLLPKERATEDLVRRFEREARAASLLEHPNIVAVYDFGDTDEVYYLAMRLVLGSDLEHLIASGPLGVTRTCVLLGQVADALDAAHARELVHRDVKPGNIFVELGDEQDAADRAWIGDFGLALLRDVSSGTRALWLGSPHYLAPERWTGSLPEPSVDVYALGCVAYACLSGQPPFTGGSEEQLRFAHAQAAPPLLSAGLAEVSQLVDDVLSRAIAKRPGDRYGTCGEFVAALRAAAVTPGASTLPRPPTPMDVSISGRPYRAPAPSEPRPAENPSPAEVSRYRRRVVLVATAGLLGAALAVPVVAALAGDETVDGSANALSGPGPGSSDAPLGPDLNAMAIDAQGNLYLLFRRFHTVMKLTSGGTLTTVAGGNGKGRSGDGGPASKAKLNYPHGLTVTPNGALLIADTGNSRIRRVDAKGTITTIAGTDEPDARGENGPAIKARLDGPKDVAVGPRGEIYVAEADGNRIRRIDREGRITTVAGTGTEGAGGDGGPAPRAELASPLALAVHGKDIYVADSGNDRVRRIDSHGTITTVAGGGQDDSAADGDPATSVALQGGDKIAIGRDGMLYIAEHNGDQVRRVTPDGRITTVAGTGVPGFSGDEGPGAQAQLAGPGVVIVGPDNRVYIGDTLNRRVRQIDANGVINTVAGAGPAYPGDGRKAGEASLLEPSMARRGPDGAVYIADAGNNRVRRIDPGDGTISTWAGTGVAGDGGDGGKATDAQLRYPAGIAFAQDGTLYIADAKNNRIRAVGRDRVITTVAGVGRIGSAGDGGPADQAELTDPQSIEVAADGSLYVAERSGNRIRRIDADRTISTVAGTGGAGFSGDGGPAKSAQLDGPTGVHVDADGNLYISDYRNSRLRKVDTAGTITTFAGNGTKGHAGDGGHAVNAQLTGPYATTTADGTVYIADDEAHRVRRVEPSGIINTFVGTGERGLPSDGDSVSSAFLATPAGISTTPDGTLLITDIDNNQAYSVKDGVLHVLAGGG
jgi:sugar lactone lactonase YvrE